MKWNESATFIVTASEKLFFGKNFCVIIWSGLELFKHPKKKVKLVDKRGKTSRPTRKLDYNWIIVRPAGPRKNVLKVWVNRINFNLVWRASRQLDALWKESNRLKVRISLASPCTWSFAVLLFMLLSHSADFNCIRRVVTKRNLSSFPWRFHAPLSIQSTQRDTSWSPHKASFAVVVAVAPNRHIKRS